MTVDTTNLNMVWASLMLEELSRLGVEQIVIAPGSRSTPLVVAAARNQSLKKLVHFDERAAAYYALGHARATGKPVALICTSGTAVANFLPAVIEASQDRIPLVILSADRPPELRDTGANQTIVQPGLFGGYARFSFDMPCPATEIDPAMVLTTFDHAVYRATSSPAGPAHLNCMFREPLAPIHDHETYADHLSPLRRWQSGRLPYTSHTRGELCVSPAEISAIASLISLANRGLLVVGRLSHETDVAAVREFAQHLGWPTIADIQSQLRLGPGGEQFIAHADLLLASEASGSTLHPDTVVHVGDQLVSKRTLAAFDAAGNVIRIVEHPLRHDPNHRVTHRAEGSIALACQALTKNVPASANAEYRLRWTTACEHATDVLKKTFGCDCVTGPAIAYRLASLIDASHSLFLASSLAIRNFDMFAPYGGASPKVAANRGASGIDGTIASAVGHAAGTGRATTLVLGDLAFLHDLNSLDLVRRSEIPVTIIVLNDNGGGIFGLLPVADTFADIEKYFIAPHGLKFKDAAAQFGLHYSAPSSLREFEQVYHESTGQKPAVIELIIDREQDRKVRNQLFADVNTALSIS